MKFERKTYYEDDSFKAFLENIDDNVFIHVEIKKFSKSVLEEMKKVWREIVLKMYFLGYEQLFTYTKDNRVVKMIGGAKYLDSYEEYEVWAWDLN